MEKKEDKKLIKFENIEQMMKWTDKNVRDENLKKSLVLLCDTSLKDHSYMIEGNMLISSHSDGFYNQVIIDSLTDDFDVVNNIKFKFCVSGGSYYKGEYKNNIDGTYSSEYEICEQKDYYTMFSSSYKLFDNNNVEIVKEDKYKSINNIPNKFSLKEVDKNYYRTDSDILRETSVYNFADIVVDGKTVCDYSEDFEYAIANNSTAKSFSSVKYRDITKEEYNNKLGHVPSKVLFRKNN